MDLTTALIAAVTALVAVVSTLTAGLVYLWKDLRGVLEVQRKYAERKLQQLSQHPPPQEDERPSTPVFVEDEPARLRSRRERPTPRELPRVDVERMPRERIQTTPGFYTDQPHKRRPK